MESARAWIESREGSIGRGIVETLSRDGALLQWTGGLAVRGGDEVMVRLSFDPGSPTLGLAARVLWVQADGRAAEGEVQWLPGPDLTRLGSMVDPSADPSPVY